MTTLSLAGAECWSGITRSEARLSAGIDGWSEGGQSMNVERYRQLNSIDPRIPFAPDATDLPQVEKFTGTGTYWKAVVLVPVAPEDNGGNHHVYVDLRNGDRNTVKLGWTWEGRQSGEYAYPVSFDKPANEPACNLAMFNATHSIWVDGRYPSEKVANLHYRYKDAPTPGSTYGHHSWYVAFAITEATETPKPIEPPVTSHQLLVYPVDAPISQYFGEHPEWYQKFGLKGHNGLDFACNIGTPVKAISGGVIAMVDADPNYGNYVRTWHPQLNLCSFVAHLDKTTMKQGDTVKQGQQIATSGNTGNSTGPHVHFEIRMMQGNQYVTTGSGYGSKGQVDPLTVYLCNQAWEGPSGASP